MYNFRKGESENLDDTWQTLTDLTEDMHEMLEKLIKLDTVLSKRGIIDHSYNNIV